MKEKRFLQEVNYTYDRIGRLVRINDPGTFFCNIEKEVCDFSLTLTFPLLWEDCDSVSAVKINGQVYPLGSPLDLFTQQSQIDTAIEDALHAYGLEGEVRATFEEDFDLERLIFIVTGTQATELSLILGPCEEEVAFSSTCCTIEPQQPGPHIPRSPDYPIVCTADLYHQLMRYNGLNIQQITIGSACGFGMRNNYEYDGLHRLTATKNVFFGPNPYPDAFSNNYSYDKAGNIQHLMRQGIIDMGPGNTPEIDTIDLLEYVYGDSSSVLAQVSDLASNPVAQPLGVNAPLSTYGHDGNGNMTIGGPVTAEYNLMNLPTKLTTSAGKRYFAYVYGGSKYSARIESDSILEETRHYLGGVEFKDGHPESYNFGDGRIVYSDSVTRPQFCLQDHLSNTVVFFEDINQDSCITTEADTSGLELEILQRLWYYPFGMEMENISQWGTEPEQWYRYNGKERDTLSGWTDYGARWGILEIGRWNGVDPLADNYYGWAPFSFTLNNPISFIDPDGRSAKEPARNQAGTIQQAIRQWKNAGLTSLDQIQAFIRNKNIDGRGTAAVRYIYTEEYEWVDLSHYVLVQQIGKFPSDGIEYAGANWLAQQFLFGEDADRSSFSYEDFPSNKFSSEIDLSNLEGDKLFNTIEAHFFTVGATVPTDAPNYTKIPFDDHDRNRLPMKLVYTPGSPVTQLVPNTDLLKTGKYTPQNMSDKPYPLENFDAAETSLEKQKDKK